MATEEDPLNAAILRVAKLHSPSAPIPGRIVGRSERARSGGADPSASRFVRVREQSIRAFVQPAAADSIPW